MLPHPIHLLISSPSFTDIRKVIEAAPKTEQPTKEDLKAIISEVSKSI